ncbi:MAG: hypothetical protein KJS98_00955, partial [Nitrospirae bacterium]|nr:hypothetical protein [Nitrospirota bacterium]
GSQAAADRASPCCHDVPLRPALAGGLLSLEGMGLVSVAGFQGAGDQPLFGSLLVCSHWR